MNNEDLSVEPQDLNCRASRSELYYNNVCHVFHKKLKGKNPHLFAVTVLNSF